MEQSLLSLTPLLALLHQKLPLLLQRVRSYAGEQVIFGTLILLAARSTSLNFTVNTVVWECENTIQGKLRASW